MVRKWAEVDVEEIDFAPVVDTTNTDAKWQECCLLYTSPSPRDRQKSRMPSSA